MDRIKGTLQMTWIEGRISDLEAWQSRNATIRAHAVEIYEALWGEIAEHVKEAAQKGFQASTNGAPRKRNVSLEKENKRGECWELQIMLVDAKDRIRAKGDRGNVDFFLDLDICPDGVVCLKLDGSRLSIEDAAIRILDPFLFPQLQSRPLG
jgi:hypothetical protein